MSRVRIAVIGEQDAGPALRAAAETIGREVARRGGVLISGGMGGVMEAASHGAAEAGGLVVGILPGGSVEGGNPYLTVPVPTGLGEARNSIVVRAADAVIAVGGAYGTLTEIAYALKLGVPLIGYETWRLTRPDRPGSTPGPDPIRRAGTPQEAVEMAWAAAIARRPKSPPQAETPKSRDPA